MAGKKKTKYMASGKKTKYMASGKMTGKVEHYKDYVKRMFSGGMTSAPAMKKKTVNYKGGGSTDPLIATNKRKKRKKRLQAEYDKNPQSHVTVGSRIKRPLDGKKSRGRKYDRSHAGTIWSD